MIYNSIDELIGNTPLVKVDAKVHGLKNIDVYAKLEYYNPFGSVKDRVAKGMLEPILDELKAGNKTVIEASSGNTAKALATLCGMHGLGFKTVTNRIKIPEVRSLLQTLGADIEELPGLSDCPDPLDPNDFTTVAAGLAKAHPDKYHYTDQYFNERNILTHYNGTGKEIYDDLPTVDYFFGFLGTCGSSMGAGKYLKEHADTKIMGVVADAGHHIPGGRNINELWEVGFFNKEFYSDILQGNSKQAVEGMLTLNRFAGILCGPTTGPTYHATIEKMKEVDASLPKGERRSVVFIACDRLEPYMSYIKRIHPEIYSARTTERETVDSQSVEDVKSAQKITATELSSLLDDEGAFVVDIRGHFAYSIGHIASSHNILDETFTQIIEEGHTLADDKKIIIVCRIGDISEKYASYLKKRGYDAYSLEGGIASWKDQGLPLIRSAQ